MWGLGPHLTIAPPGSGNRLPRAAAFPGNTAREHIPGARKEAPSPPREAVGFPSLGALKPTCVTCPRGPDRLIPTAPSQAHRFRACPAPRPHGGGGRGPGCPAAAELRGRHSPEQDAEQEAGAQRQRPAGRLPHRLPRLAGAAGARRRILLRTGQRRRRRDARREALRGIGRCAHGPSPRARGRYCPPGRAPRPAPFTASRAELEGCASPAPRRQPMAGALRWLAPPPGLADWAAGSPLPAPAKAPLCEVSAANKPLKGNRHRDKRWLAAKPPAARRLRSAAASVSRDISSTGVPT